MTKKSNKKGHIDTYTTVYGVDIAIANKDVSLEELRKRYTYFDGVELEDSVSEGLAYTCTCTERATGKYVVLTKFNGYSSVKNVNKTLDIINTASHEATHVVLDIYTFAGQIIDNSKSGATEHIAYFVGWVTEKIYETWTKK